MHRFLDGSAGKDDIRAVYLLLLARPPENDIVIQERIGQTIKRVITDILGSGELGVVMKTAIEGGRSPYERLAFADFRTAAKWVARFAPAASDVAGANWWVLLDALLGREELGDAITALDLAGLRDTAASQARESASQFYAERPLFTFDADWYLRVNEKARLALSSGMFPSAEDYFLADGIRDGQQALPAFPNNRVASYRKVLRQGPLTIEHVLAQMEMDARAGELTHWLFSAPYYAKILDWKRDAEEQDGDRPTERGSYLDFLLYGDGKGYNPHPLFCPFAYRSYAGERAPVGAFADYIRHGCLAGRRTSAVFDDDYYLVTNADARYALLTGTHVSALHHFLTSGMNRDLPFSPDFDPAFYLTRHPDIETAIRGGHIPSASYHFIFHGLAEGYAPNPYFSPQYYRERQPHAPGEMRELGIRSELEHFLLIGKARGYKPSPPLVSGQPAMDAAKAVFQRRTRRSFNTLSRTPLDFTPFSVDPAISLIVPVFNEVEFTARFLECAYFAAAFLKQATGLGCEVIVVDNGSEDGTDRLLARCPGLVIVRFPGPIGFPRAVNAGVAQARGKVIVVANNDIEFAPDTLVKVHGRLAADDWIGLLGGLTILPNETLQEAGSFLDHTAGVIGLGRHEDPWNEYFQGVHEADYCTGSFIAFRRADYDAVDGFDEAFSPGYYEETDFSFRLHETLGKKAAIDSAIQINHFEHASFGKGRPPTTAYALIRRNQARFAEKHRAALAQRPSPLALRGGAGAKPQTIDRTRLLVIEDLMPDRRLGSGFVRSAQLLGGLSDAGVAYDLLVLNPSSVVDDYSDPLVTVYRGWMAGEDVETVLSRDGGAYSHIMVCRTHNLTRFGGLIERLRHQHGFKVICDTEALSVLRLLETKRQAGRPVDAAEQQSAVRLELDAPVSVAHWIAVSPYERELIEAAGFGPTSMICHRFDRAPAGTPRPFDERRRVLAVGAIHEAGAPNHDGLLWFMDRIYGECREAMAGLTLTIVGYWHPEVRESFEARYTDAAIEFAGVVSEARLAELYAETRIAIAPTRFAAGVASKVLEPMMLGVPVVMTDLLEEQIVGSQAVGTSGLAVARRDDGGRSFADWMCALATDAGTWERVREAQYAAAAPLGGAKAFDDGIRHLILSAGLAPAGRRAKAAPRRTLADAIE
ncbi:glycosyltransferase [Sphingomonas profundi]|uniref:glycosyltransferase n=1 Tax=Alterirhizorhabdus profundi TaxID=2681549 RepID=UPI0012E7F631|nr:glycosyltransferase [Sphingomonas profundi]